MLQLFVFGIALAVGLYLLVKALADTDPRLLARGLRWTAVVVGILVLVFLAVNGRLGAAVAMGAFLLPLLGRWRSVVSRLKAAAGPSQGQSSGIRTRFLHMHLDHDTGTMSGEVVDGPYRGRQLDGMTLAELADLLTRCRTEDAQSAAVLEAFLDRNRPDWRAQAEEAGSDGSRTDAGSGPRDGAGEGGGRGSANMTRDEAYEILGLEPGASPEAIREAHRRLMLKLHPDQGGSTYLAAKINQAKDLLLKT